MTQYDHVRQGNGLMVKVYTLLVINIFFIIHSSDAQRQWSFELWHEGKIVLLSGDTLKGLVKYDITQDLDLVQYEMPNQRSEAFSARKVLFFEIFDSITQQYRRFFALPYNTTPGYKAPIFFELLVEGKMTLLARESLENRIYTSPYFMGGSYTRLELVYKYYFMEEDGSIVNFVGSRMDLLNKMGNKAGTVDKYMKTNKLRFDDRLDLTKIVTYYNSLYY